MSPVFDKGDGKGIRSAPTGATVLKRTKVSHLKRGQAPWKVTTSSTGVRTTHTNATPVYVNRGTGGITLKDGVACTNSMTPAELTKAQAVAARYGWKLILRAADIVILADDNLDHLEGDLDCDRDLLNRLNAVGRDLGVKVFVRSGRRTMDEQWALWNKYGSPRAAYPSEHAPHVQGIAADAGIGPNRVDIGEYPGAREAMKRHGLSLRVPGEDWHVEVGTVWAA